MKRKNAPTWGNTVTHAIYSGGPSPMGSHFATMAEKIAAIRRAEGNRTPQAPAKP